MMIPVAIFLLPVVIAGLSDDGTFNLKSNSSLSSTELSTITSILTLLIVVPLANVAVSVAALKSIPPVSQTILNPYIMMYVPYSYSRRQFLLLKY